MCDASVQWSFGPTIIERLLKAIRLSRNLEVKSILTFETGTIKNLDLGTLLHTAAYYGNATIARYLVDRGCNVDYVNCSSVTALMLAIGQKSQSTVQVLLKAKANIEICNNEGLSTLKMIFLPKNFHVGIGRTFFRHLRKITTTTEECAKKLAEAGCNLYHAIRFGDLEVLKLLLSMGYNINSRDKKLGTALHAAVENGDHDLTKWLIDGKHADVNSKNGEGSTPLYVLYKRNSRLTKERLAILELLIDRGADLMNFNCYEYPQLLSVVKYGPVEAVQLLMQRGHVDYNKRFGFNSLTLIHSLAKNMQLNVFQAFQNISHLKVDLVDICGETPLFVAARHGNERMVKFLLARGADPNNKQALEYSRRSNICYSPLFATFESRKLKLLRKGELDECVWVLLQNGADPQISKPDINEIFKLGTKYKLNHDKIRMLVAHLALMEMLGIPIAEYTRGRIDSSTRLKKYYQSCRKVLQTELFEYSTIVDLLTDSGIEMKIYLRDKLFVERIKRVSCKYKLRVKYSYYYRIVKLRTNRIAYKMRLDYHAAANLKGIFDEYCNMPDIVVQMMIQYFDRKELQILCGLKIQ